MRILLVYPGHAYCTFDVAHGYECALRACGHQVRAFNYHSHLSFYQEAISHWEKRNPDFRPPDNAYLVLASERVAIEAVDFVPDVVLIVTGMALHRRAFELLYRLNLPLVLLLTESPYLDRQQAVIAEKGHVVLVLANDKASVVPLREAAGVRTEYLPHSFDSARHYPMDVGPEYRTDVFFHGTLWPERRVMLESLRCNGHRVRISGIDPHIIDLDDVDEVLKNQVDNVELVRWYNGTRIALNHHRTFIGVTEQGEEKHISHAAWSLGPRAYEIAACGVFQLCDDTRPELEVFGDTVATYRDAKDLQAKVDYYLAHDDEREEMGWAAYDRVQACSFDDRAEQILIPLLKEVL